MIVCKLIELQVTFMNRNVGVSGICQHKWCKGLTRGHALSCLILLQEGGMSTNSVKELCCTHTQFKQFP